MAQPGFWDDQESAQKLINQNNELKAKYDNFKELVKLVEDLEVLLEMVAEEPTDQELLAELEQTYAAAANK